MKTEYDKIVNVSAIGGENPIKINEVLRMAGEETVSPSNQDKQRNLLIAIDMQNDFMENGALGVANSHGDVERLTKFIYNNMDKITRIACTIDTHSVHQIFHQCWWVDQDGNHPAPYTQITLQDLDDGKWMAAIMPAKSREYVKKLEAGGKKKLMIWPYHCLQGTTGCALEGQLLNMVNFHAVARNAVVNTLTKGQNPVSEMYGFLRAEDTDKPIVNPQFLDDIETYDKVIIAGEAADYCVYESLKQLMEYYSVKNSKILSKVYVLRDCMSGIGDADTVNKMYEELQNKYKFNIVESTDNIL